MVSTLPPIHVALIGTDRILKDMNDVLGHLRPDQISDIAFITGPSRTADIERVLTIDVHGPERLIVGVVFALRWSLTRDLQSERRDRVATSVLSKESRVNNVIRGHV